MSAATAVLKQKEMETTDTEVKVSHNVCLYNKYGYCKFRSFCKFQHVEDICYEVSCEIELCHLRHPKVCSYYRQFNYCKFGSYCSYLHRKQDLRNTENIQQEQSKLKDDIQALSKLVADNGREITSLKDEVKSLAQTVSNFEADKISKLEKRLQEMGDNNVIYFGAVDELEYDVKVLKTNLSSLIGASQRPSSNIQMLPVVTSSLSSRPP